MGYWDDGDIRPQWPVFLTGAAVGAVVVGLIWFIQASATRGQLDEPPPESSERQADSETEGRLARCQEVFEAQTRPLRAAEKSLSQWEVHIGAMNRLVTGAITLEQAREFWEESRVSADGLLAGHASAVQAFGQRTARCPKAKPGTLTAAEARCVRAVSARGKALYEASVAHATWRRHVGHMEMLRSGEMSPEEATQAWLMNWRQGAQELRAYRAAARAAEDQTC